MSKETLKLALEALRLCTNAGMIPMYLEANKTAIKALEEALAKQEQPAVRTGNCLRVGVCASEGHKIQAKQEQGEPVAWMRSEGVGSPIVTEELCQKHPEYRLFFTVPLYTTPQPKQKQCKYPNCDYPCMNLPDCQENWIGLTLEERDHLWEVSRAGLPRYNTFAGLVEAKLKEKNT